MGTYKDGWPRLSESLSMLTKSLKWEVPEEQKLKSIEFLSTVINDPDCSPKDRIKATETLFKIDAQRATQLLALASIELKQAQFERMSQFDDGLNSDFSGLIDVEVVSDTPVPALEDLSPEEDDQ